jgi:hypothetical protein
MGWVGPDYCGMRTTEGKHRGWAAYRKKKKSLLGAKVKTPQSGNTVRNII